MFRHLTLAAIAFAALSTSPVPIVTGAAMAQACGTRVPGANCGPSTTASTYECSTQLGHLRRVHEEDLEAIDDPDLVSVVPICSGDSYGLMRSDGNAGALRQVIANNEAMMEALFLQNFGSDDVVGIRMTGPVSVILYVHPFLNK